MLNDLVRAFLIALQFLTLIPVSNNGIISDKQWGYSALFYPLIGLLIGVSLYLFSSILINLNIQTQASLILLLWIALTGGLHLDGLADCADAWVGGFGDKQRSLAIMKDPAAGPIAVVALVLLILLKWSLIISLIENQQTIVLIPIVLLGRLSLLIIMSTSHYIREAGLGKIIITHLPLFAAKGLSLLGLALGLYYLNWIAMSFMLSMLFIIRYQANKRLGGVTGDVYGATVELVEASLLLGIAL